MSSIEISKIKTGHKDEEYLTWSGTPTIFGRHGVCHDIFNATDKTIKYANFTYEPINHFGDAVAEARSALFTGPLCSKETAKFMTEPFWTWDEDKEYCVRLVKVEIEYIDGSKEEIEGKKVLFLEDEKSSYQSMIEAEKAIVEKREKAERKTKGFVVAAGKTDSEEYKTLKEGVVTFYLGKDNYGIDSIVGWGSTEPIKHLEIPSGEFTNIDDRCLVDTGIESITLPRSEVFVLYAEVANIDGAPKYGYYGPTCIKKVIIPKETKFFASNKDILESSSITEIEFEDPCGWGVKKKIITDPKKMYNYLINGYRVKLRKSTINRIKYKLGL